MSEMLDRVVLPNTDADVFDLLMVNSFNEWHEDTQIEPTIVSPATNTDDTPSGKGYTAGYYYEGYGNLYLDILREKTLPDIPGDFNRDGRVDLVDLAGGDGWRQRFGADVDGDDFLDWQRNLGYTHWPTSAPPAATIPEPTSYQLLVLSAVIPMTTRRLADYRRHRLGDRRVRPNQVAKVASLGLSAYVVPTRRCLLYNNRLPSTVTISKAG